MENDEVQTDFSLLLDYPLFGVPPVKPVAPPPPPPKKIKKVLKERPKITLTIVGILASGDLFLAIIKSGGFEDIYSVGHTVGHLKIIEISKDTVVFSDGFDEHTAFLNQENIEIGGGFEEEVSQKGPTDRVTKNAPKTIKRTVTKKKKSESVITRKSFRNKSVPEAKEVKITRAQKKQLKNFRKTLATNPLEMLGKINTTPYRENGRIVGFRLNPGSERSLFFALQLQPGDIVTQINGTDLSTVNNFKTGMALMNKLSSQNTISMIVERGGSNENIFVDFTN